jgi:hypothetical protein
MTEAASSSSGASQRTWWDNLGAGGIIALEAAGLAVVTLAWAVPCVIRQQPPPAWAVAVSAAALAALLTTLLTSGGVLAMALQTFWQCVRMKVAVAFIVLLAAALAVLPSQMKGDGTLAGAIRALLSYGTSITALLLSVVTVLLATNVVSSDIARKQIFLTATKPLARWQYVLGRWLGVVLLDAMLLALAMGTVYALAQHLRAQPDRLESLVGASEDRRSVETEVFAARGKAYPDPADVEGRLRDRLDVFKKRGVYQQAVDAWLARTGGDPQKAEQAFIEEVHRGVLAEMNSAGPGRQMLWTFSGIRIEGGIMDFPGTVEAVDRGAWQARLRIEPRWAARMIYQTPVHVDQVDGRVADSGEDFVVLQFYSDENFRRLNLSNLVGREVRVIVDPPIQLTYKFSATGELPNDTLTCLWALRNPQTNAVHAEPREDPSSRPNVLTVSSRVVDANGRVEVQFINETPTSVQINPSDVYILFPQGSFEWNYLRATLLMLLQLAFLAALGVLAGSFLSFPVAVLLCMALLLISLGRPFIADAVKISSVFAPGVDLFTAAGYVSMQLLSLLLPDFGSTWPSDNLVDGLYISWTSLGETASLTVGLRALAALALGCLIFRKRELARVQV